MAVTSGSPLTPLATTIVSRLKRAVGQNYRSKNRLTCGSLVTANEHDSRVTVLHGCFSEGGNSILSDFS